MPFDPTHYPIVIRVLDNGYLIASQPDLEIVRTRGKFSDIKRREEIGAAVLDVWEEIMKRSKDVKLPKPSHSKTAANDRIMVSVSQAAKAMGVSVATIRRMCKAGKLSFTLTGGGHRRIKLQPSLDNR